MRKIVFPLVLLASAFVLPTTAHADAIDDFVMTGTFGNSNVITFSLPASPPGNTINNCPPGAPPQCIPQYELSFNAEALVTTNGVTTDEGLTFLRGLAGGGFYIGEPPQTSIKYIGPTLYVLNGEDPTFVPGTYDLISFGSGPTLPYSLTITPETIAPTPEPSTLALFGTGLAGLIEFARTRKRRV